MKKLLLIGLALGMSSAAQAAELGGTWITKDASAHVAFEACGSAKVCAKFVWLRDESKGGKPVLDSHNDNPQLRSRRVLGLRFAEFSKAGGGWHGNVYNPEDGQTYSADIKVLAENKLEIKGCAGPLCDSETWTRSN